jgi:hypothetical protein
MAFERRDGSGGAVDTELTADITNVSLSLTILSATGWPSGGANGPFFIIIDYDVAGKEKVEVASRTGTTLTVANTSKRGIDDTPASGHLAGAKVRFCFTEQDRDEANYTMAQTVGKVTTKGDLIAATAAQTFARLAVGANNTALVADSAQATGMKWAAIDSATVNVSGTPTTIAPDDAAAAGSGPGMAKVDHRHGIAGATAVSIGTANAEGVSTSFARADHTHDLIAGSVAAGDIAAGAVANGAALLGTGQSLVYVQAGNPGAVGANLLWFNTTKRTWLVRNAANTAWEVLESHGLSVEYTPTLFNVTLGSGGLNKARYRRSGGNVIGDGMLILGTGGDVTGRIAIGLPVNAKNYTGVYSEFFFHAATRASDVSVPAVQAAVGVVSVGTSNNQPDRMDFFATAGVAIGWDNTIPFDWTASDRMSYFFEYEPASLEDTNFV